jgi:hypothetical protein
LGCPKRLQQQDDSYQEDVEQEVAES